MPRATWKGFLNLSLVSVAVKAYTATSEGSKIELNQLHADCHSRIRYEKTCPIHGTVSNDEIVKGYQFAKDQYVIIDLDELEKLRTVEEGRSIRIDAFVPPDKIDPIYLTQSSYFLTPDGPAGQKPFALIHKAMNDRNVVCIAKVVLSKREQLVLIRPVGRLLCMTSLRYANQIKNIDVFDDEVVDANVSDAELSLAKVLIDETTKPDLDMDQYRDEYLDRLNKLIEVKVSGDQLVAPPSAEPVQVINLMDALKASVEQAQQKGGGEAAAKKAAKTSKSKSAAKAPAAAALKDQLARKTTAKTKSGKRKQTG